METSRSRSTQNKQTSEQLMAVTRAPPLRACRRTMVLDRDKGAATWPSSSSSKKKQ